MRHFVHAPNHDPISGPRPSGDSSRWFSLTETEKTVSAAREGGRDRGRERSVERAIRLRRESVHLMRWEVCVLLAPAEARGKRMGGAGGQRRWRVSVSRLHSSVFKYHQPSPSHSQEAARTRPRAVEMLPRLALAGGSQSPFSFFFLSFPPPPTALAESEWKSPLHATRPHRRSQLALHFLHLFNYPAGHKWPGEIPADTEQSGERCHGNRLR